MTILLRRQKRIIALIGEMFGLFIMLLNRLAEKASIQ